MEEVKLLNTEKFESEHRDKPVLIVPKGNLGLLVFGAGIKIKCFSTEYPSTSPKFSIETLIEEMKPLLTERHAVEDQTRKLTKLTLFQVNLCLKSKTSD